MSPTAQPEERGPSTQVRQRRGRGGDSIPVKGGSLPCIESISELLHQVVLPRQSEDALFIQAMLEDELCTLLHKDGHQVGAKFLLIGYGLIQALAKHRWEEKNKTRPSLRLPWDEVTGQSAFLVLDFCILYDLRGFMEMILTKIEGKSHPYYFLGL